MSGRRAIVHIGAPRTGTTTLQTLLCRHRTALLARGVLYPALTPDSAPSEHINHQHLGEALDGRRTPAERRDLLASLDRQLAASTGDVAILSYERLGALPRWRGVPALLAGMLARHGYAMEILLTVRPQAGAAQSHYLWRCQFLREARPFQDTFERAIRAPRLDPAAGLSTWLRAAEGRAVAVPLKDARSSVPLASRIVAELGLGDRFDALLTPVDLARAENRSLGPAAAEVSRRLRVGGARIADNGTARRIVDVVTDETRRRGLDDRAFQGLDAAMIDRAEERFARANAVFARRMWGEPWSDRVAPDRAGPIDDLGRCAPSPEVEAKLAEICAAVRARTSLGDSSWASRLRAFARIGRG